MAEPDVSLPSFEERLVHYLQIGQQLTALQVKVGQIETKIDHIISSDTKTEKLVTNHEDRLVAIEAKSVATDSKWNLGIRLFDIVWGLLLAVVAAGVWFK